MLEFMNLGRKPCHLIFRGTTAYLSNSSPKPGAVAPFYIVLEIFEPRVRAPITCFVGKGESCGENFVEEWTFYNNFGKAPGILL